MENESLIEKLNRELTPQRVTEIMAELTEKQLREVIEYWKERALKAEKRISEISK